MYHNLEISPQLPSEESTWGMKERKRKRKWRMQLHDGGLIVLYSVSTHISVSVIRIKESKGGSWFEGNMYKILPRDHERKLSFGGQIK
jgi:hypothetical protein